MADLRLFEVALSNYEAKKQPVSRTFTETGARFYSPRSDPKAQCRRCPITLLRRRYRAQNKRLARLSPRISGNSVLL